VRLVILSAFNALVAEDLSASIAEWDPTAAVRIFASHADTAAGLAAVPAVFAILVQGQREAIEAAGLPALTAARGGRLVWMAEWPPRTTPEREPGALWIRVDMPFDTDLVREALEAAARADDRPLREA
jgi:hypothetical protein